MIHSIHRAIVPLVLAVGFNPNATSAQSFQGPSGPGGGPYFDNYRASGQSLLIKGVTVVVYPTRNGQSDVGGWFACMMTTYPFGVIASSDGWCGNYVKDLQSQKLANEQTLHTFTLSSGEYIAAISGSYTLGKEGRGARITKLNFYTSAGNHYTYGSNDGTLNFDYSVPAGQRIVGFTGRGGGFLNAIGVVYAPLPSELGSFYSRRKGN